MQTSIGDASVYHAGEIEVQERAGVRSVADRSGQGVRRSIPPVGAEFLRARDLLFVAATDTAGRPMASLVSGQRGFLDAVAEETLRIAVSLPAGDPIGEGFRCNGQVGLLAMDFQHRRRMRVNGTVMRRDHRAIYVRPEQVYSNCSKYIQTREIVKVVPAETSAQRFTWTNGLSEEQRLWIARADTFFVATAARNGADMSHRGGNPGFVRVDGDRLVWGDYRGNSMFNTLGNTALNPQAALLFVDFEEGRTLQLAGSIRIDWSLQHAARIPGAERLLEFHTERALQRDHVIPQRFRLVQYSAVNPDPA